MDQDVGLSGLAAWLAAPDRADRLEALATAWRDQEAIFVLAPVAPVDTGFGAHLRRSFLGALAPGASDRARAGRACSWDPPCALDVFLREHLRAGGDGLPKPYVLAYRQDSDALAVTLRVFGTACDWFPAAAEAMAAGLQGILPWAKVLPGQHGAPHLVSRLLVPPAPLPDLPEGPLTLRLAAPLDDEGARPGARDIAAALMSRAVRRVDAMARWQGLALAETITRALTAAAHGITARAVRLHHARRESPNRQGQSRRTRVLTGEIDLPALPPDLRLVLALACRTQLGRHTNEGLGALAVTPVQTPRPPCPTSRFGTGHGGDGASTPRR